MTLSTPLDSRVLGFFVLLSPKPSKILRKSKERVEFGTEILALRDGRSTGASSRGAWAAGYFPFILHDSLGLGPLRRETRVTASLQLPSAFLRDDLWLDSTVTGHIYLETDALCEIGIQMSMQRCSGRSRHISIKKEMKIHHPSHIRTHPCTVTCGTFLALASGNRSHQAPGKELHSGAIQLEFGT